MDFVVKEFSCVDIAICVYHFPCVFIVVLIDPFENIAVLVIVLSLAMFLAVDKFAIISFAHFKQVNSNSIFIVTPLSKVFRKIVWVFHNT